jgi:hypothetical protein
MVVALCVANGQIDLHAGECANRPRHTSRRRGCAVDSAATRVTLSTAGSRAPGFGRPRAYGSIPTTHRRLRTKEMPWRHSRSRPNNWKHSAPP